MPTSTDAPLHLDSTILIERLKGKANRSRIDQAIGNRLKSTSSYAMHEVGRTWVRDLHYLLGVANDETTLPGVLARVQRLSAGSAFNKNKLSRCLEILVRVTAERDPKLTPPNEIAFFRSQLTLLMRRALPDTRKFVDSVSTGTGCWRGEVRPRFRDGNVIYSLPDCRREDVKCSVHVHFDDHRQTFVNLGSRIVDLTKPSTQLVKANETIQVACKDVAHLCDDRRCAKIGDMLIATDSNAGTTLVANNASEWDLIAKELGRELINPVRDDEEDDDD